VSLEEHIRYHHELLAGEEVEVSCTFSWEEGKTFRIQQQLRRIDGVLCAEITNLGGLLDLNRRRLIDDPAAHWRSVATTPMLIGL
jgi:acyl-CoA thioester hydrolase